MMFKHFLLVGLGGAIGSVLRYTSSSLIKSSNFPYATIVVNILGSLIIGMVMAIALKNNNFNNWRLFLVTGVCGGFTTFSALSWETLQMLQQQRYNTAIVYIVSSLILGLTAAFIGYTLLK
jgi:fluoride exporter